MNNRKTVVIIDDHPCFRTGAKHDIECDNKYEVVGEAGNAAQGLRLAKQHRPDIAIVDLSLPDMNGIALISKICEAVENTEVMVVSFNSKIDYVAKSIQAGAKGYVVKSSDPECLRKCIDLVAMGKEYIDDSLSDQMCELMNNLNKPANEVKPDKYGLLTNREQETGQSH